MVSKPISSVNVLTTVGQTICLSPSSLNLVTGPCWTASSICASDGGRCAVTSSAMSSSIVSAYAAFCLANGETLNWRIREGVERLRQTLRLSGRKWVDLTHIARTEGECDDLTMEAGLLRTAFNISRDLNQMQSCTIRSKRRKGQKE